MIQFILNLLGRTLFSAREVSPRIEVWLNGKDVSLSTNLAICPSRHSKEGWGILRMLLRDKDEHLVVKDDALVIIWRVGKVRWEHIDE